MDKRGYVLLELIASLSFMFILILNAFSLLIVVQNQTDKIYQNYSIQNRLNLISSRIGSDFYKNKIIYKKIEDNNYELKLQNNDNEITKIIKIDNNKLIYGGNKYSSSKLNFEKIEITELENIKNCIKITITYNKNKTISIFNMNGSEENV